MQLNQSSYHTLRTDLPEFKAGDTIVVKAKIKEGSKERVQAFEGVVLKRQGAGIAETFTVRKMSAGIGVEKVFPLNAPNIVSIERKVDGFVRRARIYYQRKLRGKAARIQDRQLKLSMAKGAKKADAKKTK